MRKVNIYVGKSKNDITKRILRLKDRLLHEAKVEEKRLTKSITYFSSLDDARGRELAKLQKNLDGVNLQLAQLGRKSEELALKKRCLREKIYAAGEKRNRYKNKVSGLSVMKSKFTDLESTLFITDDALTSTAIGLKRSEGFLDPRFPVTVTGRHMSFVTKKVYIVDTAGRPIPYAFGPFKVVLDLKLNDVGGTTLVARTLPVKDVGLDGKVVWHDSHTWNSGERSCYAPHPHISTDLIPCLGTTRLEGTSHSTYVEQHIKNTLLPEYRITEIIALFEEFFRTYTRGDAYTSLAHWVGTNKWDHPERYCTHCDKIRGDYVSYPASEPCACIVSRTGSVVNSREELAPCGYTWNDCISMHKGCHKHWKLRE